jgi:hypothetical protein
MDDSVITTSSRSFPFKTEERSHNVKLKKCESAHNSLIDESNVYDFLVNSICSSPIIRSNSYTIQDTDRQRRAIQDYFQSGIMVHDPDNVYFPYNLKGRRLSKSLPELYNLRLLNYFNERANNYNNILESEFECEDEEEVDSFIASNLTTPTWANKSDFLLTIIGSSFGLNHFWRFSYFGFINHGGYTLYHK